MPGNNIGGLKRIFADKELEIDALREIAGRKACAWPSSGASASARIRHGRGPTSSAPPLPGAQR
ncbi:MAG TPA: hypothetical protein VF734_16595 [Pseudonocardiaceae bacterium]